MMPPHQIKNSTANESVGARVRAARDRLNLNQVQLGEQAGVPEATLKSIESGRTKTPQTKTLEALAKVLRVDPGFLRTGEAPPPPVAPKV